MRTIMWFAGFHRQPLLGLLRGFLYLEVCGSRSASGIELEITIFGKPLLYILFLALLFFRRTENLCVLRYRFPWVTVTAYRGTGFASPR